MAPADEPQPDIRFRVLNECTLLAQQRTAIGLTLCLVVAAVVVVTTAV